MEISNKLKISETENGSATTYTMNLGRTNLTLGLIDWNAVLYPEYKVHFTEDLIYRTEIEKKVIDIIQDYLSVSDDEDTLRNGIIYLALCALDDNEIVIATNFNNVKGITKQMEGRSFTTKNERLDLALAICEHTNNPYTSFCINQSKRLEKIVDMNKNNKNNLLMADIDMLSDELNRSKTNIRIKK